MLVLKYCGKSIQTKEGIVVAEYSIENGYYVTYKEKNKKIIASISIRALQELKAIRKMMKPLKKDSATRFVLTQTTTGLSIRINTADFHVAQKIVADITKEFSTAGYRQACFYTGSELDISLYRVGKEMVTANDTAVRAYVVKTNQDNAKIINPVLGLLGGVIGILLGVTIWTIISLLGYFIWWVGFLIMLLGIQGFILLGKGITRGWGIVLVIMGLVGIVFSNFVEWGVLMLYTAHTSGISVTVGEVVTYLWKEALFDTEIRATFLSNLILGLVFGGVGMITALPSIPTKDERDEELFCTRII